MSFYLLSVSVDMLNAWIRVKPWSNNLHVLLVSEAIDQVFRFKDNISKPVDQQGILSPDRKNGYARGLGKIQIAG